MTQSKQILAMLGISKAFPGVQALKEVDFDLIAGEVHALVGENGAGKSTLMKILGGVYQPDQGSITLKGRMVPIHNPREAGERGISIVHQELNLFPNLSIAENIFGGNMPSKGVLGFEDRKLSREKAAKYLEQFMLPLDPNMLVSQLSIAQQQVIEILKAIAQDASILILDEPTSSLAEHETEMLFKIIEKLKEEGIGIIYISHRLEEIFQIANRVSVLRDGQHVGTEQISEVKIDDIIRMMVGRDLKDIFDERQFDGGKVILDVKGLSKDGFFENIDFTLNAGEILGFAGLIGAGRSEVGLALFGALSSEGKISIEDESVEIHSPEHAMSLGIAYLSENRKTDGLFFNMGVRENISVSHLDEFSTLGLLNHRREGEKAKTLIQQLRIQTPSVEQKVLNLSGGNQQKVVLARWLAIKPKILIVDEPTRGIDVGAKLEIYSLLQDLASQGVGVIVISSEMPEILGISDRIIVMHEGKITGELLRNEATEEKIMALATSQELIDEPLGVN